MARAVLAGTLLCFFLLLPHHTAFSSGILVGFSYDAREPKNASWSPTEALSFLERNSIIPFGQFKLLLGESEAFLDSLPTADVPVDLCLREIEAKKLLKSRASATSWLENYLRNPYSRLNISSVLVSSSKDDLPSLFPTLQLLQESLKAFNLDGTVKVSAIFSLSTLENLDGRQHKAIQRIMRFLRDSASFIVVEAYADEEISSLDGLHSTLQSALSACAALPHRDIPMVLQMRASVYCTGAEVSNLNGIVQQIVAGHPLLRQRISGIFFDISQLKESQQKDVHREEDLVFTFPQTEFINRGRELRASVKMMIHDTITYPSITPITVPATNPAAPAVVTVPATNPVTVVPTNPTMTPVTIPPLYPTNPLPTPVTMPMVPVTNPATTPTTFTPNSPVTNPVTTYPSAPTWSTPSIAPPTTTVPSTYPVAPAVSGQMWCLAKTGVPDYALQSALDYACGIGGVDCSALQPTGACYNPNTLQAHASYSFNSYYQRNPVPTSCDFGGTAMLTNTNPSTATCIFSSSSAVPSYNPVPTNYPASTYNPASTTPGSTMGSGSSVFNTNNPGGSSSVFSPSNPTGYSSSSFSLSADWTFSLYLLTIAYISSKIW